MARWWLVAMILLGPAALASPIAAAPPCLEHEITPGVPAPTALRPSAPPTRPIVARSVAGAVTPVVHFPDLDALACHATWNRSVRSLAATYGQSFLAVEFLIERSGHGALVKVLGSAGKADDPRDGWDEAFSTSYREFANDFRAHLKNMGRPATGPTIDPMSSR